MNLAEFSGLTRKGRLIRRNEITLHFTNSTVFLGYCTEYFDLLECSATRKKLRIGRNRAAFHIIFDFSRLFNAIPIKLIET
jgi:hypothetical protein